MKKDTSDSLYLEKIEYDKSLDNSFMAKFISNIRLIALLIITIVMLGTYALQSLPREVNPEVNIPIVSVVVAFPGANPNDIEELVVKPIENAVVGIKGIDNITATSSQGVGTVAIYFTSDINVIDAEEEVKSQIDQVVFPDDALDPFVASIDFSQIPVLDVLIYGDMSVNSVSKVAKELENNLEEQEEISKVETFGLSTEVIKITLDLEKLQNFGLTPDSIIQTLQSNDINFPSGQILVNEIKYQVSVDNAFKEINDVRNQVLSIEGEEISLSEIADVRFEESKSSTRIIYVDKNETVEYSGVQIRVYKPEGKNINETVLAAQSTIESTVSQYNGIQTKEIENVSDTVNEQFGELSNNIFSTILLVFIVLFIFIGLKQASIASISIPLTFLSAFTIMYIFGITLNFLSVFSLLLALGLVVDDAIVVVSAYKSYSESNKFKTPLQAGLMVYRDYKVPIYTTTLTTIWAFLPLLLTGGIIGEFIKSIPIVVTATLISSTTIAVFINIPLVVMLDRLKLPARVKFVFIAFAYVLVFAVLTNILLINYNSIGDEKLDNFQMLLRLLLLILLMVVSVWFLFNKKKLSNSRKLNTSRSHKFKNKFKHYLNFGLIDLSGAKRKYSRLLSRILFSKKLSFGIIIFTGIFVFVSFAMPATGLTKNEFFPSEDTDKIYVNLEGPSGWDSPLMEPDTQKAIEFSMMIEEVNNVTAISNARIISDGSIASKSNYSYLILDINPDKERSNEQIASELRTILENEITISVDVLVIGGGGPPVGSDIQINIYGESLAELEKLSNEFMLVIEENPYTTNVSTSLTQTPGQISVNLNSAEMANRNISAIEVAGWLRTLIEGSEIGEIGSGNDETQIIISSFDNVSINQLENIIVPTRVQTNYTLGEISEITLEASPESIEREDRERVVRVTASVEGKSGPEVYKELEVELNQIEIPEGYEWSTGGANEENQEATSDIVFQMRIALLLILLTVVLQLNSFRKAFLVLLIIPLAVAGVFFFFTITGTAISFPAIIGILSLFGIVVNNTIMLVEKINVNHSIGLEYVEGIVDACASRAEPIFFTSVTTIVGLLSITLSDPIWRGLGGAIIAGLLVSGLLILFVLPILYKFFFDEKFWSKVSGRIF